MEILVEHGQVLIGLAIACGFFMTWGIGANDVANAMGTSVGSKAITVKQAIVIAAIFEFAGAFLAGGHVTKTIRKGIIDPAPLVENPQYLVYGMIAALLAAGTWLAIASWKGWPVSTTHSIVGALVGFAIAGIGVEAVQWDKIATIVMSWVVSPAVGGVFAFLLMTSITRFILNAEKPFEAAQRLGPFYLFLVGFVIALVTLFKGLKHLDVELTMVQSFLAATVVGTVVALAGRVLIQRVELDEAANRNFHFASVEKVFAPMMIFTACAMAFAHGSNDVANGIGPLAAVVSIIGNAGDIAQKSATPNWILLLGGFGIVFGLSTLGYRVMRTIGTKITELRPTRGFSAELAAAATVVLASRTGLPVSTTHVAVGAVIGVGLARGIGAIDLRVIGGIVLSWIVTLPIGGLLAAFFFFTLKGMFG